MGDVYTYADPGRCLAWLGEDESDMALEKMPSLASSSRLSGIKADRTLHQWIKATQEHISHAWPEQRWAFFVL
jgi:hypothetical protein